MVKIHNALQIKAGAKTKRVGYNPITQPVQFLLNKNKDEDWCKWNMDWLEKRGLDQVRSKYKRLLKNYSLANGIIDRSDYIVEEDNEVADLIDMLTDDDASALELKFYPIIPNVIKLLVGEFTKRRDKVLYRAVDDKSYNELIEEKRKVIEEILMAYGTSKMQQTVEQMGLDLETEEGAQQAEAMMSEDVIRKLPEIESFFKKDYRSIPEQWATHQHNVDTERFYIKELEETAFGDMLKTDSEFWHFKMNEDDYDIEVWNPILTFYEKAPETKYISDGTSVGRFDIMTIADVIDKYGYKMTKEQIESLESSFPAEGMQYILPGIGNDGSYYDGSKSHTWNTEGPSLGMRQYMTFDDMFRSGDIVDDIFSQDENYASMGLNTKVRVTTAYWKTQRLVGHLTKIDEVGFVSQMIIDENYKITTEPIYDTTLFSNKSRKNLIYGEHIDWIWINETWGGVKIGKNTSTQSFADDSESFEPIYIDVGKLKYQFKGSNSLYGCKLPVEGAIFSERNTKSTSLVDSMKPYQIGFNLINNQISDMLIDELGTVILLDQNFLPQQSMDEDWGRNNLGKAYVAMKNFQILPLDSTLANTENSVAMQHAQVLNLEQTNRLLGRVQLANFFKQQCFESIGITPQRLGGILSQETATGVEQAINMSYSQTEMYFVNHSEHLMPRVHQMRTDLAQHYHSTNPSVRLQYMTSMEERINFTIDGTTLPLRELNVYITTKINQKMLLEQMKQLALTNNTTGATIYDLGNILKSDSISEVDTVLRGIEEKANEAIRQQQQHEEELARMEQEAKEKEFMIKAELEAQENALDRENRIAVAEIRAAGYGSMVDLDKNEQNDFIDNMEYLDKRERENAKIELQRGRDERQTLIENKKLLMKEKELNTREKIANKQLEIARENKNRYDVPKKKRD